MSDNKKESGDGRHKEQKWMELTIYGCFGSKQINELRRINNMP
jgi:hypothetical protein